jgi:hypothetical protein
MRRGRERGEGGEGGKEGGREINNTNMTIVDVNWCGELASSLDIKVPWIMCSGEYRSMTFCNICFF